MAEETKQVGACLGRIDEYSSDVTWKLYLEKVEFYFSANEISDEEKKKSILLSSVGSTTFSVLRDIIVPVKLQDIEYKELIKKANEHFQPQPSEIVERFKFQKRMRRAGESISDFIRDLRRLSEYCNFGSTLEDRLRDQVVFGIQEDRIQQKLLDTRNLTLTNAMDIAFSIESATAGVKSLHMTDFENRVNKVQGSSPEEWKMKWKQKHPNTAEWVTSRQKFAPGKQCYRCLKQHDSRACPYKNAVCHLCKKTGHIKIACRAKHFSSTTNKQYKGGTVQHVKEYSLNYMKEIKGENMWTKTVYINNVKVNFEIDTGAAHTIMSKSNADTLFSGKLPLIESEVKLRTYTRHSLTVLGELLIDVVIDKVCVPNLTILVIKEEGPSLIGKTWLKASNLFWPNINMVKSGSKEELIKMFPDVFADGIGTIKGPPVSVKLKNDVKPVFLRARTVPFALRKATDLELERLSNEGILKSVDNSDWASPIVIVPKPNGAVRICGDYRATVNASTENDNYPLPRMEELYAKLAGAQCFTVFDLKDAYFQQPVDEETSKLLTINTHKGLYRVLRLPFGVKFAPGLFQRKIENILKKFEYVGVFLDDVIVSARTEQEHNERVECILKCFSEHGIRLNKEKFKFMVPEVCYLGHKISKEGIKPIPEKVEAIVNAPSPVNVSQLRSFLGLLSYYRAFLPNISDILEPLYRLLDNDVKWSWSEKHEKSFQKVKQLLCKAPILEFYDVNKDVILSCDASDYGIGCVLSHITDGNEKPIAYASRTMNKSERNYAQIDKEALSIIFGVTKFNQYLAGKSFKIFTDHKPLIRLFDPVKKIPDTLSPRMLRWSLMLSGYDYRIEYREGKNNKNADALSRLPLPITVREVSKPQEVMFVSNNDGWPVTSKTIAKWTLENTITKQVLEWVLHGWPQKNVGQKYEPYFRRRDSISCLENCLLWGHRVIIPEQGHDKMLKLLHSVHQGISSMKAKARSVIWWPNMDQEIEQMVNSCCRCQMFAKDSPKSKPLEWKSGLPWERIHIDYAGPFQGKYFLVIVDSYTKWLEVKVVPNTESKTSIKVLRKIFATFGLPLELVSDNATSFTSYEFREFLRLNGIKQILIPPYHPASNGQAERYVQTVKNCLRKLDKNDITLSLSRFLLENHSTPHAVTGKTPAELMFGRSLRTALHLVVPEKSKMSQPLHKYRLDESVFVKNFGKGKKWMIGKIIKLLGSKWVLVKRCDGVMCKRHVDQLRHNREINQEMLESNEEKTFPKITFEHYDKDQNVELSSNSYEPTKIGDLKTGESQSSSDIVTENIVNNECNRNGNNIVSNETVDECVNNKSVDKKKTVCKNDITDHRTNQASIRRSNRSKKPVVRLNYEGRGVVSREHEMAAPINS